MYVVTVEFEIHPDHIEAFRQEMLLQAANSLDREAACRQFDVCFDPDRANRCFLYEKYGDRVGFDAHLESEHFRSFDAMVAPWVITKVVHHWVQCE